MAQLIWSPRFLQDVDNACEYIANESPQYAYLFAERLVLFIKTMADQPLLGAIVPEYGRVDLRERLFQNYRVVYRVSDERIELVTLIHAARLFPSDISS
jgi:toxin ParE1/3/4